MTEASLLVARCARGTIGEVEIRGGRRTVEAGPLGALCFLFDLEAASAELPLARAVAGTDSIAAAHDALEAARRRRPSWATSCGARRRIEPGRRRAPPTTL